MDEDGSMVCTDHPFKNNTPAGGICAFCLQEKLGKLVSSSFPIAVFPASSSSSSPSFRSAAETTISLPNPTSLILPSSHINPVTTRKNDDHHYYSTHNRSRILYLLSSSQKKKKNNNIIVDANTNTNKNHNHNMVFKRSKSTATPNPRFMDNNKRGFWSFFYLPKHNSKTISSNANATSFQTSNPQDIIVVEENEPSPCQASFDRKVSRSRSVGCGSRSFSGDFFERISTGFGDCTLRRVESQREGKSKVSANDCIKERVRCGGLFSGFMITSSSSSSSSSSYWVASNPNPNPSTGEGVAVASSGEGVQQHSRSKSWGWALASPMRAFSKSSTKRDREKQNPTPNLGAIPSLLSVRS